MESREFLESSWNAWHFEGGENDTQRKIALLTRHNGALMLQDSSPKTPSE